MEFGMVTHALGHTIPFEEMLATTKELGFSSVLLLTRHHGEPVRADGTCPETFPDVLRSDPEHVLSAMNNAGLKIGSVHFSAGVAINTEEDVDATIAALRLYAEYTLSLGCKFLTLPVPSCASGQMHVPTEDKAPAIKRYARLMNTVAEEFADAGLSVGCDIHSGSWVETLTDCRLLLDSMPSNNAGLLMNIGHLTTSQVYGWILVDEYPDRIPVVGWKDHSLDSDLPKRTWSVELGTGHSPFELYIKRFKQHPAERLHLINCENVADEQRIGALGRSLRYLQDLWEEINAL
jgi:sugar phosphate isomerase/epimerase